MKLSVVGQRKRRYDGLAHVTGKTRFVDDLHVPGTLMVKALRSPVAKGKIRHLDTSAARRLDGVADVITHEDVPNNAFGVVPDRPVLAETIRYAGEPIAAVAAVDERTASRALDLIHFEIDEEQPVFDPFEAMRPGAPRVRPEGNCYVFGERPFRKVVLGDVEAALREADVIVEGEYRTRPFEHAALETQVALAVPGADGSLTIHSVCQSPLSYQAQLAAILQIDREDVRLVQWAENVRKNWKGAASISVRSGVVGGSFGGKSEIHTDHIVALLALRTGRPVKWRWTRKEELLYSSHRGSWHISIRDGVMRNGRIVARKVRSVRDAGAYTGLNAYVVDKHCFNVSGPYSIPNVYVEGYCVYTNRVPASSMRGFGVMPATFAVEVQMNKIASRLEMDPWELRFINAYRNGDRTATRRVLDSVYLIETMQACARKAGRKLPDELLAMTSAPRDGQG